MTNLKTSFQILLTTMGVLLGGLPASAQGTAFTYQGQLKDNTTPANGLYNLTFELFSTNSGGTPAAGPVTNQAVVVSNGLFTVSIDFGFAPWTGSNIWLQVCVATNGSVAFATLTPRQQVTPTPYALYAENANAAGLTGSIAPSSLPTNVALLNGTQTFTGQNAFSNPVGIGTTNPQSPLEVVGNNPFPHLDVAAGSNAPYGAFLGLDATATSGGNDYLIFSTGGSAGEGQGKLVFKNQTAQIYPLVADSTGRVGIGATSPQAQLEVDSASPNIAIFKSSAVDAQIFVENTSTGGNNWSVLAAAGGNQFAAGGLIFQAGFNQPPLVLAPNGYVGIDGTPATKPLTVGAAYCDGNNWVNASDRALKENFQPITPRDVLDKLAALPITEWNYKRDKADRHLGPVAQDFHAAFGLNGTNDTHIASVDEAGVALAAIQGLNQKVEDLQRENANLTNRLAALEKAAAQNPK